jgi:uncharacterized metal-binding protein YceD (DUF177 family)
MTTTMAGELSWDHLLDDIPATGLTVERTADAEERQRLAAALDLVAVKGLTARYQISPLDLGRYQLSGEFKAQIEQTCVVTLEPVVAEIADSYAATYWPEAAMPAPPTGQVALDAEPEPEAIVGDKIDAGRIVFESLAAAIDPYPRLPGAEFEGPLSASAGGKPESPFAVLASLKHKD